MSLKCPFYNTTNACNLNKNCLFLRNGGCAIILAATMAEANQKAVQQLGNRLDSIEHNVSLIARYVNQR